MSTQKFSIVIEIRDDKIVTTGFLKADAAKALAMFNKLREENKEAYYFQHPVPDKRCKSTAQMNASLGVGINNVILATATDEDLAIEEAPLTRPVRNKIKGL
jgi:hypothetical protein